MLTENRTKVLISIIGLIGILGGAFIANWDKIFPPDTQPIMPMPENGRGKPDTPHEPPSNIEQAEISQRIEELQFDLVNNEREQMKAHEEIERLRPFLKTDKDAQQAIENQERWLEELEMSRNQVEREIEGLHERRQDN